MEIKMNIVMPIILSAFIGTFINFSIAATFNNSSTLRFVHIIFRHGKRTPITYFQDDPNNNFWVDGPGQLTKEGKQNSYALGRWFRQRYSDFLGDYVQDNETYIQSTDKDRTISTAQLFAAGLYPPKNREIWNSELGTLWQPFPVHTPPQYTDPFVDDYTKNHCPRFQQLFNLIEQTPEGRNAYNQNKQLIDLLQNKSGVPADDKVIGFLDASDTISMELFHDLKPPDWLSQDDVEKVKDLLSYFSFYYIKTKELIQLNGGKLIQTIMSRMVNTTKNPTSVKVYVYSAHDYTIMFLLSAMRMFNYIMPPFSSAVIIELHETSPGEYSLQVLYRNDSNHDPYVLQFPSCTNMCPWQKAWDATKGNYVDDLTALCVPFESEGIVKMQEEYNKMFPA